jgi:hypothetical protein
MMACSITEYQEPKPIYDKLDRMLSLRPTAIKNDAMKNYLEYFNTQCTRSQRMDKDKQVLLDGIVPRHKKSRFE